MRVTTMMRDHVRDLVMKKVQDRLEKAENAYDDQATKDKQALDAVREYAASLIPAMTEKVAAFAKKQGLTMFKHPWNWSGEKDEDPNYAFSVAVDHDDFEETNTYSNNKSPKRKMRQELEAEPKRIRQAVEKAANSIVFSLELGKVKKAELEELIESTEVEL